MPSSWLGYAIRVFHLNFSTLVVVQLVRKMAMSLEMITTDKSVK
jgi:hypothetical protein